jgi:excisionase family DNA binding protein
MESFPPNTAASILLAASLASLPELLLVPEVADFLRTSESTVFYLLRTGRLSSVKPARRRLIPRAELVAFLERGR